jgi:hypothetical protein
MSSVSGDDVCLAVLDRLRGRLDLAIAQRNLTAPTVLNQPVLLDPIVDWRVVADFTDRTDGQLPQVAVESPGFAANPGARLPGRLSWSIVITLQQRGTSYEHTVVRTQRYVAAVHDVLLAAPTLQVAGRDCDVQLVGVAYDEVDPRNARTLGAGYVEVTVTVPEALDVSDIPADPNDEPVLASTPVTSAIVTVTRRRPPP